MPELPEVETIKRVIKPQIKNLVIDDIIINRPEIIEHPAAEEFYTSVKGQTICGIKRRGKFLIIPLENGGRIILHLRMTGRLLVTPKEYPQEKHTHIIFKLSNGNEVRFSDTRRFGRFWLVGRDEEDTYSGIHKLGLEPFDKALTAAYLNEKCGTRKKAIKECLLEQNIVAGIGNIYSDEILFTAAIYPKRKANSLNMSEWGQIAAAIPERLKFFIEKNKITAEEYLKTKGQDYRNTPFLQVYGRAGEPCLKCGKTLCKIVIGGRSSVYCPNCQKIH